MRTIHWNKQFNASHLGYGVMSGTDKAGHCLTQTQDLRLEPGLQHQQLQLCRAPSILMIAK